MHTELRFIPSELPNPLPPTAPENVTWIEKQRAEVEVEGEGAVSIPTVGSNLPNAPSAGKSGSKRKMGEEGVNAPAAKKAKESKTASKPMSATSLSASTSQSVPSSSGTPSHMPTTTSTTATTYINTDDMTDAEYEALVEKQRESWKDLFDVNLNGDEDESVEIYDSCDEIRDKIKKYLQTTGTKNAAFLRDIALAGWPQDPPRIQSKQLNDFMTKQGAASGSTSRVFYGAYVYFEKKRIFEDAPKSEHRQDMEDEWPTGMPRERNWNKAWIGAPGTSVWTNEYGKVTSGVIG